MTDLQWAIVAAAVIVLSGVIIANRRESSRAKKTLERSTPAAQDEPIFSAPTERVLDGVLPSEISETIAVLQWQQPMSAARIEQEVRGWRHVGSKPLSFGWISRAGDPPAVDAESPDVVALQVGLLLATRSGPLHAMEFSEWQEALTKIAGNLGAQLILPSMSDVLARARMLNQQCEEADAQLMIAVTADQLLSSATISSAAHSAGLESRGEARFAKGPLHHQRFSVFPGDGGVSLMLLLDIPRTTAPLEAFNEMVFTAQTLATLLDARVTDTSGRPLIEADIAQIGSQVKAKQEQIEALGITPGSTVAQRLFL